MLYQIPLINNIIEDDSSKKQEIKKQKRKILQSNKEKLQRYANIKDKKKSDVDGKRKRCMTNYYYKKIVESFIKSY